VITGQTRRRWAVMSTAAAVLLCLHAAAPAVLTWAGGLGGDGDLPAPRVLLDRALRSAAVPFSGLATSRGSLGLPDLPLAGDVAAQFGGTTRTRIWWSAADRWRVDVLTPTGEQGIYDIGGQTWLWDYEKSTLTGVLGTPELRLPRPDDLDPPQLTRRLLSSGAAVDTVEGIGARRRIAGVQAAGIRIRPGDVRSTIGHVDVWLDPLSGLPVAVSVVDASGMQALASEFVDLDLAAPAASDVQVPSGPVATRTQTYAQDLAARISQSGRVVLPDRLAGFGASQPVLSGTAAYGTGLVRFAVVPVSRRRTNPDQLVSAVRASGAISASMPGGQTLLISSGALHLVVARADDRRTYVLTGLVDPQILLQAAGELVANPPPVRGARLP
jgi:hypothetical protein